ncbi:MAG: TrkH family potassium uptake protein [Clostridium sp.]|jgi:trk system potassium uptake protein TrkH|nr:TrkH family potassium uptake protein [Clostridium sp.]
MNFSIIRYTISWILKFEGLFLLLPSLVGLVYREYQAALVYALTAAACLVCSLPLNRKRPARFEMYPKEGFFAVALSWTILSIVGAFPFVFTGDIPNYAEALFETISGFTTTGASILEDVTRLTHAGLFWRSFTHWIGGMGVFVFIMAILPLMGGSTMNLMRAESTGPSVGKLVPKVKDTAKILYELYLGITVAQVISLCFCGVSFFDSLLLTFGTVGTGGFGIRNDSLASYSAAAQNVVTLFMVLSGINFTVYFCLLRRQWKEAFSIEEVRWYLGIIAASALVITLNIFPRYASVPETLRHAFFQVGSVVTTTGYSTADFDQWPQLSKTILLILMFIGACAGSTGGGIKVSRILTLFKTIHKEISILAHPRLVKRIKMGGKTLPHEILRSINVFLAVYCVILLSSILLISVDNLDFTTNFSAVIAALNNIGPGFSLVGPTRNFSLYSDFSKVVLMFDMLAGRLELFPLLILFTPSSWKKY